MSSTNFVGTLGAYPLLSDAEGLALQGKFELAAQLTLKHLRQHPDEPRGLALLGEIAMQLGALIQAEQFLRRAIARGASSIAVRRNLASVLNQQERLDEARTMFETIERESSDPTISGIRALILDKLGRNDEALAIQERLTADIPNKPHHWIAYGHSLRAAGRVEEAVTAYRQAIAADPECGEAWWGLASIKRKLFSEADIVAMREAIAIAIDVRNSAPLHFSLARAMHDRQEYEAAFEHYSQGNQQRAETLRYDARELTNEIVEIERVVDRVFIDRLAETAIDDVTPIFIVSLPRSGSTLLEQMLGSHPAIEPIGELPYAPAILRSAMELATRHGRVTVPELISRLDPGTASAMGADYLRRAALHRKTGRPYFIDKLPHNWSNILFIKRILPNAKFIDIRRDPMDCCFSNFTQSFSSAHAASFALRDIGQCYVDYLRLMKHLDWVAPDMLCHVDYGRLIDTPEDELRPVIAHLGLNWDGALLNFHKLDRVVRTPSSEQVRRPLNRDGVDTWKPYAEWLGPLRETLGVA